MKNYILFYFLIININANSHPFAALLVDQSTQEEIVNRLSPIADPLVTAALTKLPHPKAKNLQIDYATLDREPKILDFGLGQDEESPHSLRQFHLSLSLKNISPHSLKRDLDKAGPLVQSCPIRTTGARRMGRYVALPLAVDTSHLSDTSDRALVSDLTEGAHISVIKFTNTQRDFIYLKPREIGEQKAKDMLENLSAIFKTYIKDMRTLSAKSHLSSSEGMDIDPPSSPNRTQESPLGKGGRSRKNLSTPLNEVGISSPRRNADRVCKKTDLSPVTQLSQISFLSPKPRTPEKALTPKKLFSTSTQAASESLPQAFSVLEVQSRRRRMFEDEVEPYARALAHELAQQNAENLRRLTKFPPVVGLNADLIKRDKQLTPTTDLAFIRTLSYGIKVQLLGLFKGDIKASYGGKENIYRGKPPLYRGKNSLTTQQHDELLSLEDVHPISSEEEDLRLDGIKSYLNELYKVPYKEDLFNDNLSSLIPSGRIWQPHIDQLDQAIKAAPLSITLDALVADRIS